MTEFLFATRSNMFELTQNTILIFLITVCRLHWFCSKHFVWFFTLKCCQGTFFHLQSEFNFEILNEFGLWISHEGFQAGATSMALTSNQISTPRASSNHRSTSNYQFEILFQICKKLDAISEILSPRVCWWLKYLECLMELLVRIC